MTPAKLADEIEKFGLMNALAVIVAPSEFNASRDLIVQALRSYGPNEREAVAVIRLLVEAFPRDDMLGVEMFALETGRDFLKRNDATGESRK